MHYLVLDRGRFYFKRRIPQRYKTFDPRPIVKVALFTADHKKAMRLAQAHNERLEAYWHTLAQSGQTHTETQYHAVVDRARLLGFSYIPAPILADASLQEIGKRVLFFQKDDTAAQVDAILGRMDKPSLQLDQVADRYIELARDQTLNKSPNQLRKWREQRKAAMRVFVEVVGNKALDALTRDDTIKFRDWWITRIEKENYISNTANKQMTNVKVMISKVVEHLKIDVDTEHFFKKLRIQYDDEGTRAPFDTEYLRNTFLDPGKLAGMHEHCRGALLAFAETGASFSELIGLQKEDIVLDAEIPHIVIRSQKGNALKTKFRRRVIPLVGYALDAFKAYPEGFTHYRDRPDNMSFAVNKYLKQHGLFPSPAHSVYSLRHSFQDRLLSVNTPDRIQADLMGHKFARPRYGEGATLAQKLEWMKRVQIKKEEPPI